MVEELKGRTGKPSGTGPQTGAGFGFYGWAEWSSEMKLRESAEAVGLGHYGSVATALKYLEQQSLRDRGSPADDPSETAINE